MGSSKPSIGTCSEKAVQARINTIEYQLDKMLSTLKHYEVISSILLSSGNKYRVQIGYMLLSLITNMSRRTRDVRAAVECVKNRGD
ncbi:hypothetical protein [Gynuella sp.]|uniref:hypothetical protein n=1 Tax=Gynuella sp. TaxID=2969146 RepID=UPI003D0F8D8A